MEAATVKSVQDGSFFVPETWENKQVPNLSADSIIIQHHLFFDQDIQLSGSAYLTVKFCAALCGNFDLSLSQNAMIYNEGDIFSAKVLVQAYFFNDGYVDCTELTASAGGKFKNDNFGNAFVHTIIHDCTKQPLPKTYFKLVKTLPNRLDIFLKCYSEIDFGDGSDIAYSSTSVAHLYSLGDSFTVRIKVYCSCDTATFEQKIGFAAPMPDTTKPCPVFSVLPNPNNGDFQIKFVSCKPQSSLLKVPLYNSAGQHIRYVYLNQNGVTQIDDLPKVASGVYYLAMPPSSGVKPQKIVVLK